MKRCISVLVVAVMVAALLVVPAAAESSALEGNFTFFSPAAEVNTAYPFSYNEADFEAGTVYNHHLAQMSLRLAMAAAKVTPENVTALYDTLGFSYTTDSIHYPDPAFDYDAGETTIGYAIGSKTAADDEGDYTLVAIAMRGHGYGDEWGSNFEMGEGARHAGFERSAKQVTDSVFAYMESAKLSGKRVKFWITGFSRAAAVANVTAHNLNAAVYDGTLAISPDDVFAYTFESPRTVTTDEPGFDSDKNIFNIINPADIVTQIPPAEWGYVRYGIDCPLPTDEDSEDYAVKKAREIAEMEKILAAAGMGDPAAEAETRSASIDNQTSRNIQFVSDLAATFVDHQNYADNCERDMCNLVVSALGEDGNLLALLLNNPFPNALEVIFGYMANFETVFNSHYPELELAWMDALTEEELSPTPSVIPTVLVGDANKDGAVNLKDVLVMRKYLSGMDVDIDLVAGDMNADSAVNMKDVLALRKELAK